MGILAKFWTDNQMMRSVRCCVTYILVCGLLACADQQPQSAPMTRECVLSTAQSADPATHFRLAAPRFSVGEVGDDVALGIISDAIIAPNGQVIITDRSGPKILVLADDGTVTQIGGVGEGPGEYVDVNDVFSVDVDHIAVFDSRLRRLSLFTLDGRFVKSGRLETSSNRLLPRPVGFLGEDTIIVRTESPAGGPNTTGLFRDSIEIDAVPIESAAGDWSVGDGLRIGIVPGKERFRPPGPPRGYAVPMAKPSAVAVGSERVFAGDASSWSFTFWDRTRDWECQEVQIGRPLEPVREDDYEEAKQRLVEAHLPPGVDRGSVPSEIQQFWDRIFNSVPMPTHQPAYRSFIVDDQDRLWIEVWREVRGGAQSWVAVSPEFELLGTLDVPQGFVPFDVRGDQVVGVRTGPYDEDIVELYEIIH